MERDRRFHVGIRFQLLVAAGAVSCALLWSCSRESAETPQALEVVPPPPIRPVPSHLRNEHREIRNLQKAAKFQDVTRRYPSFLEALQKSWGAESADLAPYIYNFALALRLEGRPRESLAITRRALKKWPDDLQLRVLEVTLRAKLAIEQRTFDSLADESFRRILQPENLPRLRGLRVKPTESLGQWAEMLVRASRFEDAMHVAERALKLDPGDHRARAIKARILLFHRKPREALAMLEELVAERSSRDLELHLGIALLESGQPGEAWKRFSRILGDLHALPAEKRVSARQSAVRSYLVVNGARALNELGRHDEAVEILLGRFLEDGENVQPLTELATAASGLGATDGARALRSRIRRLQHREKLRGTAAQARAAGYLSSVKYYRALAALEVQRTGDALSALDEALNISPKIPTFYFEKTRVLLLLGRLDLAEKALRSGLQFVQSPVLFYELARLASLRGQTERTEKYLGKARTAVEKLRKSRKEKKPQEESLLAGLEARVLFELESYGEAKAVLQSAPPPHESEEVALLCRAELAIVERRYREAKEILSGSFQNLPGGPSWSRALRSVLAMSNEEDAGDIADFNQQDPSDLLDHPRLLLSEAFSLAGGENLSGGSEVEAWLDTLRAAHLRRQKILSAIERLPDREQASRWQEILALYRELHATRKSREVAWYLIHLSPRGLEERRALVSTLSEPEEIVPRIQALESALRLAPGDAELTEMLEKARAFLGWVTPSK